MNSENKEKITDSFEKSTENNNTPNEEENKSTNTSGVSPEPDKTKEQLSEKENQYIRLLADYQNLQKRVAQEKEDLYKFAAQKTIEGLLPALDNFEFAKSTIKQDAAPEKMFEDFNLLFESLNKCLKEVGLEAIEETGIPFDPFKHEPLQQVPTNELPDQTVMQILKKGYILNDKVIRPASVTVSVKQENKE